jgi:hypothetical protein
MKIKFQSGKEFEFIDSDDFVGAKQRSTPNTCEYIHGGIIFYGDDGAPVLVVSDNSDGGGYFFVVPMIKEGDDKAVWYTHCLNDKQEELLGEKPTEGIAVRIMKEFDDEYRLMTGKSFDEKCYPSCKAWRDK